VNSQAWSKQCWGHCGAGHQVRAQAPGDLGHVAVPPADQHGAGHRVYLLQQLADFVAGKGGVDLHADQAGERLHREQRAPAAGRGRDREDGVRARHRRRLDAQALRHHPAHQRAGALPAARRQPAWIGLAVLVDAEFGALVVGLLAWRIRVIEVAMAPLPYNGAEK
jgi:hypothetical protein